MEGSLQINMQSPTQVLNLQLVVGLLAWSHMCCYFPFQCELSASMNSFLITI
jgi:hypothetical protein